MQAKALNECVVRFEVHSAKPTTKEMCMTCRLSGNALVPSEPLYTKLACRRRQPPPFPHLARALSPDVVWSFPGGRAEHESAELFLQASLQSKVVTVVEEKCSEAQTAPR